MSFKEIGRITMTMFFRLYGHYKAQWDMEMRLTNANVTYEEAWSKAQKEEEWF